MRILIVTPFRYHAIGGVASAVRFLGAEFASQGHDVAVLARGETSFPRGLGRDRSAALFSVHFRDLVGELTETGWWRQLRSIAACLIWLPFSLWGLWRLLRTTQPDVVMIQYPRPRLFCFAIMRAWSRWKLVVTFQGSDAHRLASYPRVSRRLMRHLVRRADGVTAVSRSLAEKIEASTSFPASSISIVPNGASVDGPASETPLPQFPDRFVVTAGKLIPRKGIDVLIRAIGRLRQEGAAIPLVVIGDGSERRALTDLAAAEKAGDLITFLARSTIPACWQ